MKKLLVCLFISLSLVACRESSGTRGVAPSLSNDIEINYGAAAAFVPTPTVNLYIENSGSMDGYVLGQREFKDDILTLLTKLNHHYGMENVNVCMINNGIYQTNINADLNRFDANFRQVWGVGNNQNTNLNHIFDQVLEQTDNQTISILFSDFIYSIPSQGQTIDLLNRAKILTQNAFLSRWRQNQMLMATTIIKMNSRFDGWYFPYTGDSNRFRINMTRPYYIFIFGNQEIVHDFNQLISLSNINGFTNKFMITSENEKDPYWSVLPTSFTAGRFRPDRNESTSNHIHGISNVQLSRNGGGCSRSAPLPLTFSVAVNFSQIEAEEEYILDPNNYLVTTNNFTITSIHPIDEVSKIITQSDQKMIKNGNPTHIIILKGNSLGISNVNFYLKKEIPQWVYNSTSLDDTTLAMPEGATFGFSYLVEGIFEAYQEINREINRENKKYFECSISIN